MTADNNRRLPPEILLEIFSLASDECRLALPFNADQQKTIPWVLVNFCSYWRAVALSFPELWTEIHLDLVSLVDTLADGSDLLARKSNQVQENLQACLTRSATKLLTFSVRAPAEKPILPIISVLVDHAERWADADFNIDRLSLFHRYLARAKNRVPNLYKLHLSAYSPIDVGFTTRLEAFSNAPKLQILEMTNVIHPFHRLDIPWSQITSLYLRSCWFRKDEFSSLMVAASNLVSFTSENNRIFEEMYCYPVLTHLENLSIIGTGIHIAKIFLSLSMPNVKNIVIRALTPFLAHWTFQSLFHSQCKPTRLTLESSLDPNEIEENADIVRFLEGLHSLTFLHLIVVKSVDFAKRLYFDRRTTSAFLPYLQTIELEDRLCHSTENIAEAVLSRIKGYNHQWPWHKGWVPLRSITLRLFRPPLLLDDLELDFLESKARKHGVEISILTEHLTEGLEP